jgi:hypothetical protein
MARPQRNNVDYFPFYCDDGKKMFYLEETYGNDGFATFLKILRELAKTDYHYLDLSKNTTLMFLSAKCKINKNTLESIINDLVDLEKFDRVLWEENKIIWCNDFVESIQDAYKKRNNECITYEGLVELLVSLGVRKPIKSKSKGSVKPQTILEYTKEEESKEDNAPKILINKDKELIFNEWLSYRKEIKKEIKAKSTLNSLAKKFNTESLINCKKVVGLSIENSWQGLFWDKIVKTQNKNKPFKPTF